MSIWLRSSQVLLLASIVLISSAKAYAEESSQNTQLRKPVNNQNIYHHKPIRARLASV